LIAAWTEGSTERLGSVLEDHNLIASQESRGPDAIAISPGTVRRIILPIEQGFTLGDLTVISEQDILGDRLVNRGRKRKAKNFISEAAALTPGDLIIHIDHGLGRYLGLQTLQVQDAPHDCLQLEYHGGAKLYLPVENIELLSRYGSQNALCGLASQQLLKTGLIMNFARVSLMRRLMTNSAQSTTSLVTCVAVSQWTALFAAMLALVKLKWHCARPLPLR